MRAVPNDYFATFFIWYKFYSALFFITEKRKNQNRNYNQINSDEKNKQNFLKLLNFDELEYEWIGIF